MKRLIIGRHSYAEYPMYIKDDLKRKLTAHGKGIAKEQAKKIQAAAINVNQIICSNATRAIETTQIYQKELALNTEAIIIPFLYDNYTTNQFITMIGDQEPNYDSILIVAHNPTISDIAYRLSPDFDSDMQPSTLAIIDFEVNSWKDIEPYGGKIIKVITP